MSREQLIEILKLRFESNKERHPNVEWKTIEPYTELESIMNALSYMEESGGEPDVIMYDNELYFVDMSYEAPIGRRSCCYDEEARLSRKKNAPETDAVSLAIKHNGSLIDESMYAYIQSLQEMDVKTSVWLKTPDSIRVRGGALFGDARYGRVFTYHNGADSYYAARGFRMCIKIKEF